jgi:hypothetical protein
MAKMKRRRLSWKPSASPQVVGYKLYWSKGDEVNYDSQSASLGNVTAVILPDDIASFKPGNGSLEIGLTAVDELGNESDMITVSAPYQFSVPEIPGGLKIESVSDYHTAPSPDSGTVPTTPEPGRPEPGPDSDPGSAKNVFATDSSVRQLKTI